MNILFLPSNIASIPAITAEQLNKYEHITAKNMVKGRHKYQQDNPDLIVLPANVTKRNPFKWLLHKLTFERKLKKWINWADIIHYTYEPYFKNGRDIAFAREKGKKIFIEWLGSDIRNPEYLRTINKYYDAVFDNGYEYASDESKENSLAMQRLFKRYDAVPILSPEIVLYLDKNIFDKFYPLKQRIDLGKFSPAYPSVTESRPLIVHSPSVKIGKGSHIIIPLIEELKKEYDFDFCLLHDISREESLKVMQKADIFLDQIIIGGYGMATVEAMSFGKPVMCFIMPEVFEAGLPRECPIVNTNADNLKEQLVRLITNPVLRHEIGIKSRIFAEQYHDVEKVSKQLLEIYSAEPE